METMFAFRNASYYILVVTLWEAYWWTPGSVIVFQPILLCCS